MEKSLSVCEKITNIRLGKFFEKVGTLRDFLRMYRVAEMRSRFFSEKCGFLLSVCRKILNIRCGGVRHRGLAVRDFFSFFFGKMRFFTERLPEKPE